MKKNNMNFMEAVEAIEKGLRVSKQGYVRVYHYPNDSECLLTPFVFVVEEGTKQIYVRDNEYYLHYWLVRPEDFLATDWYIVDEANDDDQQNGGLL